MIKSEKGRELLRTVSPIYEQNKTMLAVFQAIGQEYELTVELIGDVQLQLFPQTATWGLIYWEEAVQIPSNESLPAEERRARILSKMQTRWPITKNRMQVILKTATNQVVKIIQNVADYTFQVNFDLINNFNIQQAMETLDEIKPAHLAYNIGLNLKQKEADIYIASALISGEEITVYPYSPKNIESKGNIYIGVGSNTVVENMTVYPRKEVI